MTTALRHFVPDIGFETDALRNVVSQLSNRQPMPLAVDASPPSDTRETPIVPCISQRDNGRALHNRHNRSDSTLDPASSIQVPLTAHPIVTPSLPDCHIAGRHNEIYEATTTPSLSACRNTTLFIILITDILGFYDTTSFLMFLLQARSSCELTQGGLCSNESNVLHGIQDPSSPSVEFPDDFLIPIQSQINIDATVFYAEINSVIYILPSEGLQDCVDRLLRRSKACRNAHIAIVYAVMSLGTESTSIFSLACHYLTLAIEEGSIATVEALMLIVCLLC